MIPGISTGGGGFSGSSAANSAGQIGNLTGPVINFGSGSASGVPVSVDDKTMIYVGMAAVLLFVLLKRNK